MSYARNNIYYSSKIIHTSQRIVTVVIDLLSYLKPLRISQFSSFLIRKNKVTFLKLTPRWKSQVFVESNCQGFIVHMAQVNRIVNWSISLFSSCMNSRSQRWKYSSLQFCIFLQLGFIFYSKNLSPTSACRNRKTRSPNLL